MSLLFVCSVRLFFGRTTNGRPYNEHSNLMVGATCVSPAFVCNKRSFFGRSKPLPYLSFFVSIIDFSSIKKQPVGESLGAPALMQNNSLIL